jgi:hypothetical protein
MKVNFEMNIEDIKILNGRVFIKVTLNQSNCKELHKWINYSIASNEKDFVEDKVGAVKK